MDNKKIGKLIADLRRKQGLTQEQLGEKVGVGFRAVSKWECGKTLPDIGIINELSKILGISSDELLAGELKDKENSNSKKKISPKIIITVSILTVIFIFFASIFIYQNNKTYTYKTLSAEENEYYLNGILNYDKGNISITINDISFKDEEFNNIVIANYEYNLNVDNNLLFGYGYIEGINNLENPKSIRDFVKDLSIIYVGNSDIKKNQFTKNNMILNFKFLTQDNEIINKEIKIKLTSIKESP